MRAEGNKGPTGVTLGRGQRTLLELELDLVVVGDAQACR